MNDKNNLKEFNNFAEKVFKQLQIPSKTLFDAMQYSFFSGGKRIRSQFVHIIGNIFSIDKQDCHRIAFAIEAIHTYSLIHDDLPAMDNDTLRRGKPTCHIKFDEATAILAGDALQALAFEVLQDVKISNIEQQKKINKLLSICSGASGMVGGQQLDIEGENKKLDLKELETIHINKTAKMFTASIVMPYILSTNHCQKVEQLLTQLSQLIGLCFQIKDDILDVTKTTQELGKTSSKDLDSNKSTYVALMGLDKAIEYLHSKQLEITHILKELSNYQIHSQDLKQIIDLVINRNY
ncbi:octaprenyl-diphosphate synthase [Candidatus Francisella endociliophora]|uniref:Octaprenyl-diphosphate synthase n=1 Tax=Candidatus Francisella endociliophora TaxID=653937 RepID=A0A097EQW6_9GAMM|nr:farnesyl diphosphate synthase [Francisella sp. FSC1006]AIT09963.1 octaprenyl-diphosphate synthase [Francisella sp. FSC1006]